jgi:predicted transcriptional regulator
MSLDYIRNMAEKVKFSVSLGAELGEALRQHAEAEDEQISTVVSRALEAYLGHRKRMRDGREAMVEYQEQYGMFTEEERARARARVADLMGWGESGTTGARSA